MAVKDTIHTFDLFTGPRKERIHRGAAILAVVALNPKSSIELLPPTDDGASHASA